MLDQVGQDGARSMHVRCQCDPHAGFSTSRQPQCRFLWKFPEVGGGRSNRAVFIVSELCDVQSRRRMVTQRQTHCDIRPGGEPVAEWLSQGRISTYPSVPCTRIRCLSEISRVTSTTPTTAGKPYSRAITAP
jgi:hypothetical protein